MDVVSSASSLSSSPLMKVKVIATPERKYMAFDPWIAIDFQRCCDFCCRVSGIWTKDCTLEMFLTMHNLSL